MSEEFVEDCLSWERLRAEQRKAVGTPPTEEEGAAETSDELTTTPSERPPVLLEEGGRGTGSRAEHRDKGEEEGRCF